VRSAVVTQLDLGAVTSDRRLAEFGPRDESVSVSLLDAVRNQEPVLRAGPATGALSRPAADPSSADVAAFLKDHGIDYIYADATRPNSLVADAVPIFTSGESEILRIP
jgi:hypothetical protein